MIGDVSTQNIDAYKLVLQARRALDEVNMENSLKARDLANEALAIDPNYADAWVVLTISSLNLVLFEASPEASARFIDVESEAAEKSVELNPKLGYGWVIKGYVHLYKLE